MNITDEQRSQLTPFDPTRILAFVNSFNELVINTGDPSINDIGKIHFTYFPGKRRLPDWYIELVYNELKNSPVEGANSETSPAITYSHVYMPLGLWEEVRQFDYVFDIVIRVT